MLVKLKLISLNGTHIGNQATLGGCQDRSVPAPITHYTSPKFDGIRRKSAITDSRK